MRKVLFGGIGLLALSGASPGASALSIEHQPVTCAVAERFPRMEARLVPGGVARARVVFQGQNTEWYSVDMKPDGARFFGVLPKPMKSLKRFRYYIEVTDKTMGTNRTADYDTDVVDSTGGCKGRVMAASLGSASILLQGPAGVFALPAGFASSGVVIAVRRPLLLEGWRQQVAWRRWPSRRGATHRILRARLVRAVRPDRSLT